MEHGNLNSCGILSDQNCESSAVLASVSEHTHMKYFTGTWCSLIRVTFIVHFPLPMKIKDDIIL